MLENDIKDAWAMVTWLTLGRDPDLDPGIYGWVIARPWQRFTVSEWFTRQVLGFGEGCNNLSGNQKPFSMLLWPFCGRTHGLWTSESCPGPLRWTQFYHSTIASHIRIVQPVNCFLIVFGEPMKLVKVFPCCGKIVILFTYSKNFWETDNVQWPSRGESEITVPLFEEEKGSSLYAMAWGVQFPVRAWFKSSMVPLFCLPISDMAKNGANPVLGERQATPCLLPNVWHLK